jgi:hypothetical protein
MTARRTRRTRRVDETTVIDLVMNGDYKGLAQLTGVTVDQIERMLDETGHEYDALDDDEDDGFPDEDDGFPDEDDGFPDEMDDDWDKDDEEDEHGDALA